MKRNFKKGSSGKLSAHLDLKEVHCKCEYPNCQVTIVDTDAVTLFEKIRSRVGEPVIITRWYSCSAHNQDVGGAPGSQHLNGTAFDFRVSGYSGMQLAGIVEDFSEAEDLGIGTYKHFPRLCHVDTRGHRSRWAHSEYNGGMTKTEINSKRYTV